jgi:hypothetical protein
MKIYTPDQVPDVIVGRVCRQSRTISIFGTLAMMAMLAALPAYLVIIARPSMWISFPVLSFASLMVMWLTGRLVNAFRSTNWLMRIAPDGLWINLRSYLNREFAPAATVLFVPYTEIATVNEYRIKRSEKDNDGTTVWTERYLDLRLAEKVPDEVAGEISEERRREVVHEYLGGFVKSRGRNNHVPVLVPDDHTLRLSWRGRSDFIVPSLEKTLRELGGRCTVGESTKKDVADLDKLTGEEVDQMIINCVETGDTFGAIKLLQEKRGFNLTDAKKFVDELTVRL